MALFLIYNNDEAFLNDIENIPKHVYSFIDQHKQEEKEYKSKYPDWFDKYPNDLMTKENVYDFVELTFYDDNMEKYSCDSLMDIKKDNVYAMAVRDIVKSTYEKYNELHQNKSVSISSDMNDYMLYQQLQKINKDIENIERGYYLHIIGQYGHDYQTSDRIYSVSHRAHLKTDDDISLDHIVVSLCEYIKEEKIDIDMLEQCNSYKIVHAIITDRPDIIQEKDEKIEKAVLKDILEKPDVDLTKIYELSEEDRCLFIDMWCDNKPMPKISIISGCVAVDNIDNECYVEEFETREEALNWLGIDTSEELEYEAQEDMEIG